MADWRVIENTGQTLVGLIERHVALLGIPNVGVGVVTPMAFPSLADTTDPFVSLFLYQIAGNAEMRGNPRRVLANGTLGRQPLPLELCYLVTAWGVRTTDDVIGDLPATQDEARLMGAILQAFYDNAELERSSLFETPGLPVWSPEDGLQIILETLPIDGHYRIWDATKLGYRLSLVYRVRVAALEPTETPQAPPLTEAVLETVP